MNLFELIVVHYLSTIINTMTTQILFKTFQQWDIFLIIYLERKLLNPLA